jgi:tetratricopeptide (TPR) repeat protein
VNLISQLNTLESSGLIRLLRARPELEYLFRHALAQDAAYNSLLRQDRKHLHLAVAESLESLYPEQTNEMSATLAYHFERAELRDRAIHYLKRAGDRARAAYANQEALDFYRRAIFYIEQLGDGQAEKWRDVEIAARESVADLTELSGNHEEALADYERVMTMLAPEQKIVRARLHRKSANIQIVRQDFERARRLFDEAETALGDAGADRPVEEWGEWIMIQLDRSWMLYLSSHVDELTDLAEKARPIIERYGTAMQRSRFYSSLSQAGFRRERWVISNETLALAMESYKAWQESDSAADTGRGAFEVGFCHLWRGEYEEAERALLYGLSLVEKTGDLVTQTMYVTYLTVLYRKLGKLDEVKRLAAHSLDLAGKTQMKLYAGTAMANLSWIAWREGRYAELQQHAREAVDHWADVKVQYPFHWAAQWPLLAVATKEGRISDAVDCARKMLSTDQQLLPAALTAALEQAIEDVEQGQTDQAQTQFEETIRMAGQMGYL